MKNGLSFRRPFYLAALGLLAGCFSPNEELPDEEAEGTASQTDGSTTAPTDGSATTSAGSTGSSDNTTGSADTQSQTSSAEASTGESAAGDTTADTSGTGDAAECGNEEVEGSEECDDGQATPTCSATCSSCMPPPPETVVDQSVGRCLDNAYPDCGNTWSLANGQSNVQAFRVDNAGTLDSVSIYALNEAVASSVITVQILDGGANALLPAGLTQAELAGHIVGEATAPGSGSYGWVDFDLVGEGIELVPGDNYYLWVRLLPPLPSDPDDRIRWDRFGPDTGTDVYPDGRAFFCPPGQDCEALADPWNFSFTASVTLHPPLCE